MGRRASSASGERPQNAHQSLEGDESSGDSPRHNTAPTAARLPNVCAAAAATLATPACHVNLQHSRHISTSHGSGAECAGLKLQYNRLRCPSPAPPLPPSIALPPYAVRRHLLHRLLRQGVQGARPRTTQAPSMKRASMTSASCVCRHTSAHTFCGTGWTAGASGGERRGQQAHQPPCRLLHCVAKRSRSHQTQVRPAPTPNRASHPPAELAPHPLWHIGLLLLLLLPLPLL